MEFQDSDLQNPIWNKRLLVALKTLWCFDVKNWHNETTKFILHFPTNLPVSQVMPITVMYLLLQNYLILSAFEIEIPLINPDFYYRLNRTQHTPVVTKGHCCVKVKIGSPGLA